jgi:hypothetical protein
MDQWSTQHRAFIVETFFKNGNYLVKTQRIFHKHFNITCHRSQNTMKLRVENFKLSISTLKKETIGQCASVALGISDCSMRRILYEDLNFRLHKIMVVQELSDHDFANCSMAAKHVIRILFNDVIILDR